MRYALIASRKKPSWRMSAAARFKRPPHRGTCRIEVMDLPTRVLNGLRNAQWQRCGHSVVRVGDAMQLTNNELCGPNFGKASLKAWKQCLDDLRVSFEAARGNVPEFAERDLAELHREAVRELEAANAARAEAVQRLKAITHAQAAHQIAMGNLFAEAVGGPQNVGTAIKAFFARRR